MRVLLLYDDIFQLRCDAVAPPHTDIWCFANRLRCEWGQFWEESHRKMCIFLRFCARCAFGSSVAKQNEMWHLLKCMEPYSLSLWRHAKSVADVSKGGLGILWGATFVCVWGWIKLNESKISAQYQCVTCKYCTFFMYIQMKTNGSSCGPATT